MLDVVAIPGLQDDGLNALPMEQVGQQKAGRTRADDTDAGAFRYVHGAVLPC
jgi:hypothetical protein